MVAFKATSWDFPRRTKSVQIMAELGLEHGMAMSRVLAGSGIDPQIFGQPLMEIEASQELRVVRNLLEHCGDVEGLGLQAGRRYQATSYDELGYGLMCSASLRDAVKFLIRFRKLTSLFVSMHVDEGPETTSLVVDAAAIPADVRQFLVERDMVAIRVPLRNVFPHKSLPVARMEFNFARPSYGEMFDNMCDSNHFGQVRNAITMDNAYMTVAPVQANPAMAGQCEAMCQKMLDQRSADGGVAARVRARLMAAHDAFAGMESISTEFEMTSRTLRRHLQAEGTSFRTVLDEVREVMADELFRKHPITVEEVAAKLGFAEASSFISAFKRWKGVSPRQVYRRGRVASTT